MSPRPASDASALAEANRSESRTRSLRPRGLRYGALAGLLYFLLACYLTPDYGPTWDVVAGGYPYGDEVVAWLQSDTADFVEIANRDEPPDVRQPYPDFHREQFKWHEVYPVAGTLSAFLSRVLWHHLGIVPPIPAHQIIVPILTAILIFVMVSFLACEASSPSEPSRGDGLLIGMVAAGLLVFSPRFLSHSMSNLKDLPECVFYNLTLIGGYYGLRDRQRRTWILTGVLTALALAQKPNALFLPFHILTFFLMARALRCGALRIRIGAVCLGFLAFLVTYLAVSPAFWHHTIERITLHFGHVMKLSHPGVGELIPPRTESWIRQFPSIFSVFATTPLTVLGFAAFGLFVGRAPRILRLFLAISVLFPIARVTFGRDFDGIRHFIEFYPGLCALAAIGALGAARTATRLGAGWRIAIPVVCLIPGVLGVVQTYPFGTCYYNSLVGGLEGAQQLNDPSATDYWGNSYWQGIEWVNKNAGPDAALHVPTAGQIARCVAPVKLRRDIFLGPEKIEDCPGEIYVMYITRPNWYDTLIYHLEQGAPTHRIQVQGGTILKIYRLATASDKALFFDLQAEEARRLGVRQRVLFELLEAPQKLAALRTLLRQESGLSQDELNAEFRKIAPYLSPDDAANVLDWIDRRR